jgi:Protein of unknown function (DUF3592)
MRAFTSLFDNIGGALVGLVVLLFWGALIVSATSNVFQVVTYRPMQVRVLDRRVDSIKHYSRGQTSYSYEPIVKFSYTVDGRAYTGRRVTPLGESHSQEWARETIDRFAVGGVYQGYYNPLDPSDAYLIRRYDARPYCLLLPTTLFLVLAGAAALLLSRQPLTPPDPALQPDGWYAVGLPPAPPRWPLWAIIATVWYGLGMLSVGPYFLLAFPSYDTWLTVGTVIYALGGVWLAWFIARGDRAAPDPIALRLAFDQPKLIRAGTVTARVELLADYELTIDDVALGFLEGEKLTQEERLALLKPARWIVLSQEPVRAQPGQRLFYTGQLTLPADKERYVWQIVVRAQAGRREYRRVFRVYVQSPPLFAPPAVGG